MADRTADRHHGRMHGGQLDQHGHDAEREERARERVGEGEGRAEEQTLREHLREGHEEGGAHVEAHEREEDRDVRKAELHAWDGDGDERLEIAQHERERGEHAHARPEEQVVSGKPYHSLSCHRVDIILTHAAGDDSRFAML